MRVMDGRPPRRRTKQMLCTQSRLALSHKRGLFHCSTQDGGTPPVRPDDEDVFCALNANAPQQCGWRMTELRVRGPWAMDEYLVHAAWPADSVHVLVPDRETVVFGGAWDVPADVEWTRVETRLGVDVLYHEASDFPLSVREDADANTIELVRQGQVVAWMTSRRGGRSRESGVSGEPFL